MSAESAARAMLERANPAEIVAAFRAAELREGIAAMREYARRWEELDPEHAAKVRAIADRREIEGRWEQ